jgi:TIR domain
MSGGVFISYRREDSSGVAGRISDRLRKRLGPKNIFFDREDLKAGREWREELAERVGACKALVAIIGKRWNPTSDKPGEHRLDDPDDTVRIEIETALDRGVPVIPVLVDSAALPKREELPESMRRLLDWQSLDIAETRFDYDVEKLYRTLSPLVGPASLMRRLRTPALITSAGVLAASLIVEFRSTLESIWVALSTGQTETASVDSVQLQRVGPPLPGTFLAGDQPAQIQLELTYVLHSADQAFLAVYAEEFRGSSNGCDGPHQTNGGATIPIIRGEHFASIKIPWPGSSYSGFLGVGANFWKSVDGHEAGILKSFGFFSDICYRFGYSTPASVSMPNLPAPEA